MREISAGDLRILTFVNSAIQHRLLMSVRQDIPVNGPDPRNDAAPPLSTDAGPNGDDHTAQLYSLSLRSTLTST